MRTDLSPAFIAAKDAAYRSPRQLLVFHFAAGAVYLSDQAISLGGNDYLPLVEEWGTLDTAGDSTQDTGEIRQMAVTIWNGGASPFSDLFLVEHPENVEVDLYQWFVGLADEDKALIDRFVVRDPISYGEASRLLTLDLVSLAMRYDGPVGDLLTRDVWPYALNADVNKGIPLVVGSPGQVKTLCARTAPTATMTGSILLLPTIVNVHEDLDALGVPAWGQIQIDEEIMIYDSRDSDTFTVTIRGAGGTTAAEHSDGAAVIQHITDHTYIVGQPLSAINDVRVGGLPAKAGTYTVHPGDDPATIIFNTKPSFIQYAKTARDGSLDFDAATAANGAYQPHYAYAEEEKSNGALLSESYTPLALIQEDPAKDIGEVVRAFLSVEHWATDTYSNDHVDVWVDGLGVVGTLARPSAADIAAFSAEVDIDHGHDHAVGGVHDHNFTNPALQTNNPNHSHALTANKTSFSLFAANIDAAGEQVQGQDTYRDYIDFYDSDGGTNALKYSIHFGTGGSYATSTLHYRANGVWQTAVALDSYTPGKTVGLAPGTISGAYIDFYWGGDSAGYATIEDAAFELVKTVSLAVLGEQTSVSTAHTSTGDVAQQTVDTTGSAIKDSDDVDDLVTGNRALENVVVSSSSRSLVQKFDLTKLLETISWDWFVNREIQLRYVGTADNVDIVVTYVCFDVEYRQRDVVFTDDVSCSPVGSINNRPDQVVQYLLHDKAGLPLENLVLAAAGVRFTELVYQMDGLFPASMSIRSAIKKICMQSRSRLVWDGGKAELVVREKSANQESVKNLQPADMQQKSINVHRQPVAEIVNDINLFYNKDHMLGSDDQTAYIDTLHGIDQNSIDQHGLRRDDFRFLFDLVAGVDMAWSLVDFYIWLLGKPATFYEFATYLAQFDLAKEDAILMTSNGFGGISELPVVVRATDRLFGSGKSQSINLYRLLVESIRPDGSNGSVDPGNPGEEKVNFGKLTLDNDEWVHVTLDGSVVDPVVFVNGGVELTSAVVVGDAIQAENSVTTRVRNVGRYGFDVRIRRWDYDAAAINTPYVVNYAVLPRGTTILADGAVLRVGTTTLSASSADPMALTDVPVGHTFAGNSWSIIATPQTCNSPVNICVRCHSAWDAPYDHIAMRIQEQDYNWAESPDGLGEGDHVDETIGWLVMEANETWLPGGAKIQAVVTGNSYLHGWKEITHAAFPGDKVVLCQCVSTDGSDSLQTNLAAVGTSAFLVSLAECGSQGEIRHTSENIGCVVIRF